MGHLVPLAPQVITWLYTKNLSKATNFLENVVGWPMIFDGGSHPLPDWSGCKVHRGSSHAIFIGICNIRDAPTSMDQASVTITLVTADGREGVDAWHRYLSFQGAIHINVTEPRYSPTFNCYAFNFYDVDADSLGLYRFEVQVFEDPSWPRPPSALMTVQKDRHVLDQQTRTNP